MPLLGLAHQSPSSYDKSKMIGDKGHISNGDGWMTRLEDLPKVQSFPRTASVDEVVEAMKLAGGVVIRNAVAPEDLDIIEKDLRPSLDADTPWEGEFFPKETRRCHGLMGKSPTCSEKVIMNPLYQAVCDKFLTTKNWFWSGHKKTYAESKPQIQNTVCFSIGPGAHKQPLHRDDWAYHVINTRIDKFPDDITARETGVGFFVAAKPATKANGATRFIPGSHLWEHEREPDDDLCVWAELNKGDAFIMFASCYHGGGANTTTDQERLLFSCFMTRGWLRQEENHYLAIEREIMQKLPVATQKVAGYSISEPFLGWVDSADPRSVLDPSIKGNTDMLQNESK